jgi:AbrB family looped-hinge helix DNA binding protein
MMREVPEKRIFEVKITSKGQMVIPKPLREKYNLMEGSRVKIIATRDGLLIKPRLEAPWIGLRGMMRRDWKDKSLDQLIEEAKRSLFKAVENR